MRLCGCGYVSVECVEDLEALHALDNPPETVTRAHTHAPTHTHSYKRTHKRTRTHTRARAHTQADTHTDLDIDDIMGHGMREAIHKTLAMVELLALHHARMAQMEAERKQKEAQRLQEAKHKGGSTRRSGSGYAPSCHSAHVPHGREVRGAGGRRSPVPRLHLSAIGSSSGGGEGLAAGSGHTGGGASTAKLEPIESGRQFTLPVDDDTPPPPEPSARSPPPSPNTLRAAHCKAQLAVAASHSSPRPPSPTRSKPAERQGGPPPPTLEHQSSAAGRIVAVPLGIQVLSVLAQSAAGRGAPQGRQPRHPAALQQGVNRPRPSTPPRQRGLQGPLPFSSAAGGSCAPDPPPPCVHGPSTSGAHAPAAGSAVPRSGGCAPAAPYHAVGSPAGISGAARRSGSGAGAANRRRQSEDAAGQQRPGGPTCEHCATRREGHHHHHHHRHNHDNHHGEPHLQPLPQLRGHHTRTSVPGHSQHEGPSRRPTTPRSSVDAVTYTVTPPHSVTASHHSFASAPGPPNNPDAPPAPPELRNLSLDWLRRVPIIKEGSKARLPADARYRDLLSKAQRNS